MIDSIAPNPVPLAPVDASPADRRRTTYDHLILGAGCSGLSLAWHLLDAGVEGSIALVDRRASYVNDRTWCFWDVEPTPFDDLATHAWPRWSIIDRSGREVVSGPGRHRYLRLRSIDFYRRAVARLAGSGRVDFHLGEMIGARREGPSAVEVATPSGPLRGRLAFDGARPPDRLADGVPPGRVALVQHFLGQTIRADAAVFDPGRAILMDFRVDQSDGPHFVYVLPLSDREALVENTYLFRAEVGPDRHRREIAAYLDRGFGLRRFEVLEEESGRIPMAVAPPPIRPGCRLLPIGLAGGAARPSSGYAFQRIQRQTRHLAESLASGLSPGAIDPAPPARRKYDFFDSIFLQALADRPDAADSLFFRMFDAVGADPLVRFLGDRSGLLDDLRLVAALPKPLFLRAAARSAPTWLPLVFGRRPG